MRFFGIDVHLEFCEVAVAEGGKVSQAGRIASTPEAIKEFARGLGSEDQVVLDASGSVMAIARILRESNVGRVIVSSAAQTRAISHARVKSDRFDAAMLARLLSAGMLSEVWVPDEATLALRRRVARRSALVRARTRIKNEVHAVVMRCLLGCPPVSDLFGRKGRVWLAEQTLPEEEAETVAGCLRQIDFLDSEIALLDQKIAEQALTWPGLCRLLTIPGVDIGTAAAVIAAVGRHLALSEPWPTGRLPRLGPEGPPVRLRARSLWAHLKAWQRPGPLDAGRGRMDRDPQPRPPACVRGARPCSPRRPGCRRRCRTQARRSLLASAEQGRGLRVRAPVADAPEDPAVGTHRRRVTPATPPRRGNRLADSRSARGGA